MFLPNVNKAAHSGIETAEETLPKVQNKGISGPKKDIYMSSNFF